MKIVNQYTKEATSYDNICIDDDGSIYFRPEAVKAHSGIIYSVNTDLIVAETEEQWDSVNSIKGNRKFALKCNKGDIIRFRSYNSWSYDGYTMYYEYDDENSITVLDDNAVLPDITFIADASSIQVKFGSQYSNRLLLGTLYFKIYDEQDGNLITTLTYNQAYLDHWGKRDNIYLGLVPNNYYEVYYKYGSKTSQVYTYDNTGNNNITFNLENNRINIKSTNQRIKVSYYDISGNLITTIQYPDYNTILDSIDEFEQVTKDLSTLKNSIYSVRVETTKSSFKQGEHINLELTLSSYFTDYIDNSVVYNDYTNDKLLEKPIIDTLASTKQPYIITLAKPNNYCSDNDIKNNFIITIDNSEPNIDNSIIAYNNEANQFDVSNITENTSVKARLVVYDYNKSVHYSDIAEYTYDTLCLLDTPVINNNNNNIYITVDRPPYESNVYYTIDGTIPNENSQIYNSKFKLTKNTIIKAINKYNNFYSEVATYNFIYVEYTEVGSSILITGGENRKLISPIIKNYVDILFSKQYEIPQVLESISYVLNEIKANNDIYNPTEESLNRRYSGDLLNIYSDETKTENLDININNKINDLNNYKYPYWDKGKWNLNYFRNNVGTTTKPTDSDNQSLIYGKYFVIRFIFDNKTRFKLETVEPNINIY